MAAETLVKKTLVLSIENGIDEEGKPVIKRYSYSNVKTASTPENLFAAATAIAGLYNGGGSAFSTVDNNDLY